MTYGKKHFKLFASCVIVKGYKRSGICDLQKEKFDFIPNSMVEIVSYTKRFAIMEIIKKSSVKNNKIIYEYINWLIQHDYGFLCDNLDEYNRFPVLSMEWDYPFVITNAIIDINKLSNHNITQIISQLNHLSVPHLQIRAYSPFKMAYYINLLSECIDTKIKTVDIITPFIDFFNKSFFNKISLENLRLNSLIFHSSPIDKHDNNILNGLTKVIYTKRKFMDQSLCGFVCTDNFSVNIKFYSESQNHNSCLNRKISIDVNGDIKNCPSIPESFGNIKDITLAEALAKKGFKKYWGINKDKIAVCKDCEFRYICTDCRAYRENPDDIYGKPLKCGYDPYTNKWEEWSTNPLKQKAMEYYGMLNIEQKNN